MNEYRAHDADDSAAQDVKRPMDTDKNAGKAVTGREGEIPPAELSAEIKNDHGQSEKPGGMSRRKRVAGLGDERSKIQNFKRPQVVIEKTDKFCDNAPRQYNGDGGIGKNQNAQPPVLVRKGKNQEAKNKEIRQIFGQ